MKKIICSITVFVLCVLLFTACECKHQWQDADCKNPKICTLCGETSGEPSGHHWKNATCTSPMMCTDCSEISGQALGHSWKEANCTEAAECYTCGAISGEALGHKLGEWITVSDSTCSEAGLEKAQCLTCQSFVENTLELKEHISGEWVITSEPTESKKGTRTKSCEVCGAEIATESFELSKEELEKNYKEKCKSLSYTEISRYPDDYEGEYVKFRGKVVQICSEASSGLYYSTYRVAVSGDYDQVIYIYVDNYGSGRRILEDDWITIYGEYDGLYSYTTVMGAKKTIPSVKVKYVD